MLSKLQILQSAVIEPFIVTFSLHICVLISLLSSVLKETFYQCIETTNYFLHIVVISYVT
jgi:hypothetical protein